MLLKIPCMSKSSRKVKELELSLLLVLATCTFYLGKTRNVSFKGIGDELLGKERWKSE
jgi:hypothetical protein